MAADISATMASLSATEGSNQPTNSTSVGANVDDNFRMLGALLAALREATGWGGLYLTSVAGTNTVTASVAAQGSITMAPTAYSTGMRFLFIPAGANTGATTLNVNSLGAKNVFYRGVALGGGELVAGVPVQVLYDGTQFNILGPVTPILRTEQATTSGSSIDFTSIPAWAKRITVMVEAVSTNGTNELRVQIGDSGGLETTAYVSGAIRVDVGGAINGSVGTTTGFTINGLSTAAGAVTGSLVLTLMDAANNSWIAHGTFTENSTYCYFASGRKSLSATLDRLSLVTADTFDAGAVNIIIE